MDTSPPPVKGLRLLYKLGAGGMGQVWLAEDETLARRVAVKFLSERLSQEPEAHARFLREARAMATLEHASVVRVYSFGEADSRPYLVMEHVEGESLADRLRRRGTLPVAETLRILRDVVGALEAAWEKGLVHRDIKPSNILLDTRGRARVADFGLAKATRAEAEPTLTQTGYVVGSPHYVSPEQARGKPVDFRTDVYSLGVVLFEALTGTRPFDGATPVEVIDHHLHTPLPSLRERRPDAPDSLVRLVEWMTRKDPSERPASYTAILEALPGELTAGSESSTTLTAPAPRRPSGLAFRREWIPAAFVLAVFLATLAGTWRELVPERPSPVTPPGEEPLVLAVAPFYGPDEDSAKEGRVMAALIEKEIARRFGERDARVLGIEDTRQTVRDHVSARALGERLGAGLVVWGECFALRGQSEVQPYFTPVPRPARQRAAGARPLGAADPLGEQERAAGPMVLRAQAPDQIELRRRGVKEVGDLVLVLAGMHALYTEDRPEKALALFRQGPKTAESLRYQGEALRALERREEALAAFGEAVAVDAKDAQAHAWRGDLLLEAGRFGEAVASYRKAADSGGDYGSRSAILFEGKLYERETFESRKLSKGREDTGYLVARDPASGRVLERHLLPGRATVLRVADNTLQVTYAPSFQGGSAVIPFAGGRFLKPVFGGWLRLRRQGTRSGWALAANFLDLSPVPQRAFAPKTRDPDAPATPEALEAALREAAVGDPTQPWHPFFLGQILWARGEKREAEHVWDGLFATAFQGVPYFEYAAMAGLFERFRQPAWADRAYTAALEARRRLAQPIGPPTLIEVLVNLPFLEEARNEARQDPSADYDRIHLWLRRGREAGGMAAEGEEMVSAVWARYFRDKGDAERARAEEDYARRARADPMYFDVVVARLDHAFYAQSAARAGFWGTVLVLLVAAARGASARGGALVSAMAGIAPRERRALVLAFLALLASQGLLSYRALDITGFARLPLALMDAIGGRFFASEIEDRLAEKDTEARRFVAAVAHHLAGDVDRAQALYRSLPGDARAARNLEALGKGNLTPPEPVTAADLRRAYVVFDWEAWLRGPREALESFDRAAGPAFFSSGLLADAFVLLLLTVGFLAVPPSGRRATAGGRAWRLATAVLPGSADLAAGRFWRGWLTLTLAAFVVLVLVFHALAPESSPAPGLFTAETVTVRSRPLPPFDLPESWGILHRDYWTLLWAFPYAGPFWGAFALAALAAAWLHVTGWRAAGTPAADPMGEETHATAQ
jgi:tRNA A-37 threonylcarbamoyl transferase component Bud32/tetratricopeptide (TPR) repeat protein